MHKTPRNNKKSIIGIIEFNVIVEYSKNLFGQTRYCGHTFVSVQMDPEIAIRCVRYEFFPL